jgi:hypothetical protein
MTQQQNFAEIAIQLVITDAISKGHTNISEIKEFMKTDIFSKAVENYITLLESEFGKK